MLVESAFSILPEIIAGAGFQKVAKEANAVSSFSYALLNTLHSKNVLEPLQRIQQEKLYATKILPLPALHQNRICDIYLNYGGSKIGTQALAAYGWRYVNYIEAKFLKNYKSTKTGQDTNAQKNSAELIADLIRLICLVPEPELVKKPNQAKTSSARYLLVLANAKPSVFITKYLVELLSFFEKPFSVGQITIDLGSSKAKKSLAGKVGTNFDRLKIECNRLTVQSHYPMGITGKGACWMLLIRIDAAKVSMTYNNNVHTYEIKEDRTLAEGAQDDYTKIRDFVANNIK